MKRSNIEMEQKNSVLKVWMITTTPAAPLREPIRGPRIREWINEGISDQYYYKVDRRGYMEHCHSISQYSYNFHYTQNLDDLSMNIRMEKVDNFRISGFFTSGI
jgi:hypothetical protein